MHAPKADSTTLSLAACYLLRPCNISDRTTTYSLCERYPHCLS
jgi:hypothetical protein